jgi:hypothetical protein
MTVFHSNTQRMIDHWRELRSGPGAPARSAFDPRFVSNLMPQLFMLDRQSGLPYRLAGGLVEDLHGRSLRREAFLGLWTADSRAAVRDAALAAVRGPEPAVIYAEARTDSDQRCGLELMLAPLTDADGRVDRLLGLCQPVTTLVRLHGEALTDLTHKLTIYAGAGEAATRTPHLKLAAVDGRRIA